MWMDSLPRGTMDALRQKVRDTLGDKLGPNSSNNYEKAIYRMASEVAKRDGVKVRDVYGSIAFDKVGQIMGAKTKEDRLVVLEEIKESVEGWESESYKPQKDLYTATLDRSVQKPKAIKGLHVCRKKDCRNDEFYYWMVQGRSCDEQMTSMRACARCGTRGKE